MNIINWLKGKKTYIISLSAILASVGAYLSGTIDLTTAIQQVWAALLAMSVRGGIAKVEVK